MSKTTTDPGSSSPPEKSGSFPIGGCGALEVRLHSARSIPVVRLVGQAGGLDAQPAIDSVRAWIDRVPGYLVFDLSECEYVSSQMLGLLANCMFERHDAGAGVYICCARRKILLLLAMLNMDDLFHLRDTVEEAIADILLRKPKPRTD